MIQFITCIISVRWFLAELVPFLGLRINSGTFQIYWSEPSLCSRLNSCINKLSTCIAGLLCDLLWSDPDKDVQGWGENDRGVSFTFGGDVVNKFLNRHDLDLICRAHQVSQCIEIILFYLLIIFKTTIFKENSISFNLLHLDSRYQAVNQVLNKINQQFDCNANKPALQYRVQIWYGQYSSLHAMLIFTTIYIRSCNTVCVVLQVVEDGYEFFAKRQLVTLFSAPNYCGEFDNAGGMMSVDETLMCSFQV